MNALDTYQSYAWTRQQTFQRYKEALKGSLEAGVLVCYHTTLHDEVAQAIRASIERLELPVESLCFVDLSQVPSDEIYLLIEGLDPYAILCVHESCADILAQIYHTPLPKYEIGAPQGRATRNLGDMHEGMKDPATKQRIWAAIKSLTASRI